MDETPAIAALSDLAVSDDLVAFLREELRMYRAVRKENGEKLPVSELAGDILAQDDTLDFSGETLRRYLGGKKQKTEPPTIRAIAGFLIDEKWLSIDEVRAAARNIDLRGAIALNDVFGIRRGEKLAAFHEDLTGNYRTITLVTDRVLVRDWTLSYATELGVLRIAETFRQYEIAGSVVLDRMIEQGIENAHVIGFDSVRPHLTRVGGAIISKGMVIADARDMVALISDARTGKARLYSFDAIGFDDEDNVRTLGGSRYAGWTAAQAPIAMGDPAITAAPPGTKTPRPEPLWLALLKIDEGLTWHEDRKQKKISASFKLKSNSPKKRAPNKSMRIIR